MNNYILHRKINQVTISWLIFTAYIVFLLFQMVQNGTVSGSANDENGRQIFVPSVWFFYHFSVPTLAILLLNMLRQRIIKKVKKWQVWILLSISGIFFIFILSMLFQNRFSTPYMNDYLHYLSTNDTNNFLSFCLQVVFAYMAWRIFFSNSLIVNNGKIVYGGSLEELDNIENLVIDSKFPKIFIQLKKYAQGVNGEMYNRIILLQSAYKAKYRKNIEGTISNNDYDTSLAQLREKLLIIKNEIREEMKDSLQ